MISSLQLRAARSMLMLTLDDLQIISGISKTTLSKIENSHPINFLGVEIRKLRRLEQIYKIYGISFYSNNKISFKETRLTKKLKKFQ